MQIECKLHGTFCCPRLAYLFLILNRRQGLVLQVTQRPQGGVILDSLVVVLPTPHEGGNLALCHHGEEWTLDAIEVTHNAEGPVIAYIALYSDVDQEVMLVNSIYRVTLTYNLYSKLGTPSEALLPSITASDVVFQTSFSYACPDSSCLPSNGGLD